MKAEIAPAALWMDVFIVFSALFYYNVELILRGIFEIQLISIPLSSA